MVLVINRYPCTFRTHAVQYKSYKITSICMKQRNKFEMKAHDVQFKKPRPSLPHTIGTYVGNRVRSSWPEMVGAGCILSVGLGGLSALLWI